MGKKVLFQGENLTNKEGFKIFNNFIDGLNKIDSIENNQETWVEYEKAENVKIQIQIVYKNDNHDITKLTVTEFTEALPNARDFNKIETLRDKYINNWNDIPEQLQKFILNCNKYWISLQEILLYKDNKIVASIGMSRWNDDIEVNSIGAGELFQWNIDDGFTHNNLVA